MGLVIAQKKKNLIEMTEQTLTLITNNHSFNHLYCLLYKPNTRSDRGGAGCNNI